LRAEISQIILRGIHAAFGVHRLIQSDFGCRIGLCQRKTFRL
jgi:hypothetical protein